MTQNKCQCGCDHSPLTMLPLGLALDLSALRPDPVPMPGCRERVDQDMHIYINGNLAESGDGLSPATAVKSYEDAVLALSRYDGCNLHYAFFHFADLEDPAARYPDIDIYRGHYATFSHMNIVGASHETTMLGMCQALTGVGVNVRNVCVSFLCSFGATVNIIDKLAVKPTESQQWGIMACCSGTTRFWKSVDVYLQLGPYKSALYAYLNGAVYNNDTVRFHAPGDLKMDIAFAISEASSMVRLTNQADFSDCAPVTGRQYWIIDTSCIRTSGLTLPGSQPGVTKSGGVFV